MSSNGVFLEPFELQCLYDALGWTEFGAEVEGESDTVVSAETCTSALDRKFLIADIQAKATV